MLRHIFAASFILAAATVHAAPPPIVAIGDVTTDCNHQYWAHLGYCRRNTMLNEIAAFDPVTLATYLFDNPVEPTIIGACQDYFDYKRCTDKYNPAEPVDGNQGDTAQCTQTTPQPDMIVQKLFTFLCNDTVLDDLKHHSKCLMSVNNETAWPKCLDHVFDQVFYWVQGEVWIDDPEACLMPYMLTDCVMNLKLPACNVKSGALLRDFIRRVRDAVFNYPCGANAAELSKQEVDAQTIPPEVPSKTKPTPSPVRRRKSRRDQGSRNRASSGSSSSRRGQGFQTRKKQLQKHQRGGGQRNALQQKSPKPQQSQRQFSEPRRPRNDPIPSYDESATTSFRSQNTRTQPPFTNNARQARISERNADDLYEAPPSRQYVGRDNDPQFVFNDRPATNDFDFSGQRQLPFHHQENAQFMPVSTS